MLSLDTPIAGPSTSPAMLGATRSDVSAILHTLNMRSNLVPQLTQLNQRRIDPGLNLPANLDWGRLNNAELGAWEALCGDLGAIRMREETLRQQREVTIRMMQAYLDAVFDVAGAPRELPHAARAPRDEPDDAQRALDEVAGPAEGADEVEEAAAASAKDRKGKGRAR